MYAPQKLKAQSKAQVDDGIGGFNESWSDYKSFDGYIDLLQGSDLTNAQNAFIEESTHVLIIPQYQAGITDDMRILDESNRWYEITYADDPVNIQHHNELYLKFGGVLDG
ncbi:phage head completion protein [Vagococcus lutrae]|uniref:phage head completion protein n=1 Tax=Vagococcus lutrae TaxID=81947 RepID=UPI00200E8C04|nr:head-tail adaptor protein [Vagococcus lutrae]MDT2824352.1 head-tail adaptor protein [Vagococcus lutrae]UQF24214.1 head-tail adaptor protein [Vagococcus lutrae]UQF63696.1 head-tail adaptor protein [Vagococcus lutrae]